MRIVLAACRAISRSSWLVSAGVLLFFITAAATALSCLAGAFGALTGAFSVPIAAAQLLLRTAIFAAVLCVLALASRTRERDKRRRKTSRRRCC